MLGTESLFLLALLCNFVLALFSLHPFLIENTVFVVTYSVQIYNLEKRRINLMIHMLWSQIAPVASTYHGLGGKIAFPLLGCAYRVNPLAEGASPHATVIIFKHLESHRSIIYYFGIHCC